MNRRQRLESAWRNVSWGAALLLGVAGASGTAVAQTAPTTGQIEALEKQIQQLQSSYQLQMQQLRKQVQEMRGQVQAEQQLNQVEQRQMNDVEAKQAATVAAATAASKASTALAPSAPSDSLWTNVGGHLTFGGFTELSGIFRSRNEESDVGSTFGSIPFKDVPYSHMSEFRGSARQSRLTLLAQGNFDDDTKVSSYVESDFLGSGTNSNSGESNSYVPRLRVFYGALDQSAWGLHFLAGQSWSLATLYKQGLSPRDENVPLTIDAQYVPGFTWRRVPEFRIVKDIGAETHIGLAFDSPQASFAGSAASTTPDVVTTTAGQNSAGATLNNAANYSSDIAPDVILKAAFDTSWGHYEIYGLGRAFRSRSMFENHTAIGGGVGAGAVFPILSKRVDLQASGLVGRGIGQYGSSQMPDVAVDALGGIHPITEAQMLLGATFHATPALDVYGYAGGEKAERTDFAYGTQTVTLANGTHITTPGAFGYGSPYAVNLGCNIENSSLTCTGNNADVWQLSAGLWDKVYDGKAGSVRVGLQYSFTRRDTFEGIGGAPYASDNITMISFRYYPFQP